MVSRPLAHFLGFKFLFLFSVYLDRTIFTIACNNYSVQFCSLIHRSALFKIMQLATFTLLSLGAIVAASNTELETQMAKLIPRETWQAWQKRDNILQGGGWALVANSCPLQSTQCTDATCCPNSLLCNPTSAVYNARAVCCPDGSFSSYRRKNKK